MLLIQKSILRDAVTDLALHYLVGGALGLALGSGGGLSTGRALRRRRLQRKRHRQRPP